MRKNIAIICAALWTLVTLFLTPTILAKNKDSNLIVFSEILPKDFSKLYSTTKFSKGLLDNHLKLYQGYVKNTNIILHKLNELSANKKSNTPEYAELKRRLGWEFNGLLLHEYYFENLGGNGNGKPDANSPIHKKIIESFGSFDNWKQDFISTGLMRGIGWAVLYLEPRTNKLINAWINEHDVGHITGATPILVMDIFEHAYINDYQLDRAKYIEDFFKNIKWEKIIGRFINAPSYYNKKNYYKKFSQ